MSGPSGLRQLDDVIDELGFGAAQIVLLVTGGTFGTLAGSVKISLSILSVAIAKEWGLTPMQKGTLVSTLFAGQLVGNFSAGFFADRFGRRTSLILSLWVATLAALASSFSDGYTEMLCWRALIGLGFGFGTSPWNAIASETTPSDRRVEMFAMGGVLFSCGIVYILFTAWLVDPSLRELDWRWFTQLAALPGIPFIIVAHAFLMESPRYLAQAGDRERSIAALERLRSLNHRDQVNVTEWTATENKTEVDLLLPFRPLYLRTTLTLCFSTFVLNYAYYGAMYALPQVLPKVNLGFSSALNLLCAQCCEVAGIAFGLFLSMHSSRLHALMIYMFGLATCMTVFCTSLLYVPDADEAVRERHQMPMAVASAAVSGSAFCTAIGFLLVYVYSVEVYPTACRAAGSGVAVAFGRLGSVLSPLAYESMHAATGSHEAFFGAVVLLALVNAALVSGLPLETKDRQLGEIMAEALPIKAV